MYEEKIGCRLYIDAFGDGGRGAHPFRDEHHEFRVDQERCTSTVEPVL